MFLGAPKIMPGWLIASHFQRQRLVSLMNHRCKQRAHRSSLPVAVWWPRDQTFLVVEVGALPKDYVSKFGRLYGWSTTLAPGSNGELRHESDTDAVRWGIVALREKVLGIPILQSGFVRILSHIYASFCAHVPRHRPIVRRQANRN